MTRADINTILDHVRPYLPFQDQANQRRVYSKAIRKLIYAHAWRLIRRACSGLARSVQCPNLSNFIIGEFRDRRLLASQGLAGRYAVFAVFCFRQILKIGQPIIPFVAVDVINFRTLRSKANEGGGDQLVNKDSLLPRAVIEREPQILVFDTPVTAAAMRRRDSHNAPDFARAAGASRWRIAPDTAKIRDRIETLIANDRSPFFSFNLFSGKLMNNHRENLRYRFELWLGSFGAQTSFEPLIKMEL